VLLAFAERRESVRDWGRIDVVVRRSDDGGANWAPLALAVGESELDFEDAGAGAGQSRLSGEDRGPLSVGNPCPVWERTSRIVWLLVSVSCAADNEAAVISRAARDTRRVFASRSIDLGRTWSRAREVTSQVKRDDWTWYATGPGGAVQLTAATLTPGRLVFPCNHAATTADGFVRRGAHVLYADGAEGGVLELRIGGCLDAPFTNECALAEAGGGGVLLLNARDMSGRCQRWVARSDDGGESWRPAAQLTELAEPAMHGCHAALARCTGPRVRLAFANPASTRREHLTVRWSADEGGTWPLAERVVVHAGPAAYCSMQPLLPRAGDSCEEGPLALLFECGVREPYERIAFALVRCGDADDAGVGGGCGVRGDSRGVASGGADGMHGAWG
jgi:sialidase-1